MIEILTIFGAVIVVALGFAALLGWSVAVSIWSAWWASKVWAVLVIPSLHLPPLPMAAAIGVVLVANILRPPHGEHKDNEEKSKALIAWEAAAPGILGGPLVYVVARVIAHFVL